MRVVLQRVSEASVEFGDEEVGKIGMGLVVLLGVGENDTQEDVDYLAGKIPHLRVFEDDAGKMNLSLEDIGGAVLLVPQFTLYGDCRKGRRPSFTSAASPDKAEKLYLKLADQLRSNGIPVATGKFRAFMQVSLVNEGPVTILLESKGTF
ncbi:MAG: D-aminoacyl-tRNA deacylase [Candidatus Brocadiia bacterium]|nr:D-tyrosyl-tRNA(Tyr) deacylase [Planctomycetota bacterium]